MLKARQAIYGCVLPFFLLFATMGAAAQAIQDPQLQELITELRRLDPDLADALTQMLSMSPEAAQMSGLSAMIAGMQSGQVDMAQLSQLLPGLAAGQVGVTSPVSLVSSGAARSGASARPTAPTSNMVGVGVQPPSSTRRDDAGQTAPGNRQSTSSPPAGEKSERSTPVEPSFADRVRSANERAVAEFLRSARTIRVTVYAAAAECRQPGANLIVDLQLEGATAPRQGGITQHLTGAWFGSTRPYVEGFGGIQIPQGRSTHAQWGTFGCLPKEFVITYDTRRYPNGPHLQFNWRARFEDYRQDRNGSFTVAVQNGGSYAYRR